HGQGHGHDHKPHESPWVMLVPLIVLSVGAVFAGVVFAPYFFGDHAHDFWRNAIYHGPNNHVLHDAHHVEAWVKWAPLVVTLIGTALAVYFYLQKPDMPKRMAARKGPMWTFLYNKWFFDELYQVLFVKTTKAV